MLGALGVGKTSLVRRFVYNAFDEKYVTTIGTRVSKKEIEVYGEEITLNIWDILGERGFEDLKRSYFKGAKGALAVCDVLRHTTIDELKWQLTTFFKTTGAVPIVIIANKIDLSGWEIKGGDIEELATLFGAPYLFTSAKTGEKVEEAFQKIAKSVMENKRSKIPDIEKVAVEVSPIHKAQEEILLTFTQYMGDEELASLVAKKQYEDRGIDFHNPDKEEIEYICKRLTKILTEFKGSEAGEKMRREFARTLRRLNSNQE